MAEKKIRRSSELLKERKHVGNLEQTFRFIENTSTYGKEFIKKIYDSLDYDICENEIYLNKVSNEGYSDVAFNSIRLHINFILVGIICGIISVGVMIAINRLASTKYQFLSSIVEHCKGGGCIAPVYCIWFLSMLVFVFIGTFVVTFIEPAASGGGVADCIAFLNGVDVPKVFSFSVIVWKTIGTICTITSGIAGGKEGPMVHICAAVGALIITLPYISRLCRPFRTQAQLRDLVAAGVACGIASNFGSPVGGFLFSVEESVSFLSTKLLFKIFLSTIFTVITVTYLFTAYTYHIIGDKINNKKFFYLGKLADKETNYNLLELPAFVLLGTIAGLVGALFVFFQKWLIALRQKYLTTKIRQMLEGFFVVVVTTTVQVSLTYLCDSCVEVEEPQYAVKMDCHTGYNEVSMYTLNTNEEALKWFIHSKVDGITLFSATSLFIVYFLLASYTVGISMAVGTFVPNLLIGAMWGRCYAIILNKIFPNSSWVHPKKYTFLASVAQLSGSLRLTFSITIIAVEITGNIQLLLPIMCSLLTAKWVGNLLSPRVFDEQVILHGIPILLSNPPPFACEIPVEQIMSKPVTTLPPIVEVNDVINTISMNNYQCYPVVSKHNSLLGSVTTKDILILLKYRIFLNTNMNLEVIERFFEGEFSKKITLKKLNLESKDFTQKLNLAMIMNPCPYVVKQNMSFERAYYLYRNLGLAQLIVVDYKYRVVGIIVRSDLSRHHPVEGGITRLPLL